MPVYCQRLHFYVYDDIWPLMFGQLSVTLAIIITIIIILVVIERKQQT